MSAHKAMRDSFLNAVSNEEIVFNLINFSFSRTYIDIDTVNMVENSAP